MNERISLSKEIDWIDIDGVFHLAGQFEVGQGGVEQLVAKFALLGMDLEMSAVEVAGLGDRSRGGTEDADPFVAGGFLP